MGKNKSKKIDDANIPHKEQMIKMSYLRQASVLMATHVNAHSKMRQNYKVEKLGRPQIQNDLARHYSHALKTIGKKLVTRM